MQIPKFNFVTTMIALTGLTLSIALFFVVREETKSTALTNFESLAEERIVGVSNRIHNGKTTLYSLMGHYYTSNFVSRTEFKTFISHQFITDNSFEAILWIPKVTSETLPKFTENALEDGIENFHLKEIAFSDGHAADDGGETSFPIFYVEPLEDYANVIGSDLATDPGMLESLIQSRDSVELTMSAKLDLSQFDNSKTGSFLIAPVYQQDIAFTHIDLDPEDHPDIIGYLIGVISFEPLFDVFYQKASQQSLVQPAGIDIYVYDESQSSGIKPIFVYNSRIRANGTEAPTIDLSDAVEGTFLERTIDVGGRSWTFVARPVDPDLGIAVYWNAWAIFVGSLIITSLITVYLHSQYTQTIVIESSVQDRTKKLRSLSEELKDRDTRSRAVLDHILDGVITIDQHGYIETFNPGAERIFGYNAEEVCGKNVKMLMPEPYHSNHDDFIKSYLNTGVAKVINLLRDVSGLRKDGTIFPMALAVSEMEVSGERMFTGIVRDVTVRKETEKILIKAKEEADKAEKQLRMAIEAIDDGFALFDSDNKIVIWNKKYKDYYTIPDELLFTGNSLENIIRDGISKGKISEAIGREEEWISERLNSRNQDASYLTERRISDGRIIRLAEYRTPDGSTVSIHTDITELTNSKEEAENANRAKSDFLSSMSHELRTPLNAIIGFGQLLNLNDEENLTPSQKENVEFILKGGEHLLELINEVLELAKIEAGNITISPEAVDTHLLINECVSLLHSSAEERDISITVNGEENDWQVVIADQTRLKQILLNLISNAIKYNRDSGTVTLSCETTEYGFLRIHVEDSGMGIAIEQQESVFEPFNRLGAEMTEIEGTGIGLTISNELIKLMNGKLTFESEEYIGSSFSIELPLSLEKKKKELAGDEFPSKNVDVGKNVLANKKVLYIEDNPANLKLMEKIIRKCGMDIVSAHSAELGIDLAKSEHPNLILLDINLPGISGYEALRILKEDSETRDTPVIAVTAAATKRDIAKGNQAGFDNYLTKPIKLEAVLEAIRSTMT